MGLGLRTRCRSVRLTFDETRNRGTEGSHCTTSVNPTLRVNPALLPDTVTLYVPFGVGPPPLTASPSPVAGISLVAEHPLRAVKPQKMIRASNPRNLALLKHSKPIGSSPASHTSFRRSPGRAGIRKSAEDVAILTVISVVPAIAGACGLTVQVA